MEVRQKLVVQTVCAIICSETKHKKRKNKRVWVKEWIRLRDQQGLSVLQRELEVSTACLYRRCSCMFMFGWRPHFVKKSKFCGLW